MYVEGSDYDRAKNYILTFFSSHTESVLLKQDIMHLAFVPMAHQKGVFRRSAQVNFFQAKELFQNFF